MDADASEKLDNTPGHRVVAYLGGVRDAARLAEGSRTAVYRWLQPSAKGGGGGLIPIPAQRKMVRNAAAKGLALAFEDFAPRAGEVVL